MATAEPSFEEIAARHRAALLGYLTRLLGREDAQDVCQETLLRAHRAFPRLVPGSNARAWLYRIATNAAINALNGRSRRSARMTEIDVDTLPSAAAASDEHRERLRAVARAVETLPPKQRAALLQRQFEGLDYDEIGTALGCSAVSARANVYQALKKLRRALADLEER
jgi:RNA polymerase sigma-70 factor (ECF subfamily)